MYIRKIKSNGWNFLVEKKLSRIIVLMGVLTIIVADSFALWKHSLVFLQYGTYFWSSTDSVFALSAAILLFIWAIEREPFINGMSGHVLVVYLIQQQPQFTYFLWVQMLNLPVRLYSVDLLSGILVTIVALLAVFGASLLLGVLVDSITSRGIMFVSAMLEKYTLHLFKIVRRMLPTSVEKSEG